MITIDEIRKRLYEQEMAIPNYNVPTFTAAEMRTVLEALDQTAACYAVAVEKLTKVLADTSTPMG